MAVNVLVPLLIPLGEQLTNVTKLVGSDPVEFERPEYEVAIPENTQSDRLLQLSARVQPPGTRVEYRIVDGDNEGVFHLDPTTGVLSLPRPLDYETMQQYDLVVEGRAGEAASEVRVAVKVLDHNDHAPVFLRTLHETQITEEDNRHLPKVILKQVTAVDGDAGEFGHLTYSISGDGIYNNGTRPCFSVDSGGGTVQVLRPLDRDPPNGKAQWRLRVTATDGEMEAFTDVRVNLKDANDNAPYFPVLTTVASVSENIPLGSSVARVEATDHDDPQEGDNARVTYSLEKNAIDETTGSAIFAIDSQRGLITTALCCLDREKTQRYAVQVVATDGGGLKGTGTVVVNVVDINDVPPQFSRPEWTLEVPEILAPDLVLATLTVVDQDVTNNFSFRVVPGSGRGWQMFRVKTRSDGLAGGDLVALEPLDYEDPDHRRGFHFRVQVTDLGEEGWALDRHVAETHVKLQLLDENDNDPVFSRDVAHLDLPEDTPRGALLATFTALDPDGGGESSVRYTIDENSDPRRQFGVDEGGAVRLVGGLDRETAAVHTVLVLAVDQGTPPRTATATLTMNVTDVNDNPPFLAEPMEVQVTENSEAQEVAQVKLGDPDDWRQGHGPPFTITLDPRAPPHVAASVRVTLDKRGDDGRGVGVVWTRGALDREERRALLVPLVVGDAGWPSLSATVTLTVHVADLNDNPMSPASKTVTVHTLQRQGSAVPLGRVYVRDPDDWDSGAKTYAWRHHPQPGFYLDPATGRLSMAPSTPDGRYQLEFRVSDTSQGQVDIAANVSVRVKSVARSEVVHSTPLTLATDSASVVRPQSQGGPSILSRLVRAVRAWVSDRGGEGVRAVSIQPLQRDTKTTASIPKPATRVWMSSVGVSNFDHILLYHKQELSAAIGVDILDVGRVSCQEARDTGGGHSDGGGSSVGVRGAARCVGGCWVAISDVFSVVDANTSAVVGPGVVVGSGCSCLSYTPPQDIPQCTPHSCLNGGRCIPTSSGTRCICPHGTWGSRCKMLARHFHGGGGEGGGGDGGSSRRQGGGWAWVPSIPPCSEVHLSLEVLTGTGEATLLYSGTSQEGATRQGGGGGGGGGGTAAATTTTTATDLLLLQLHQGRPSLLLDLGGGPVSLSLNASYSLADNTWHRIDLVWKDELVEMMVDLCTGGVSQGPPTPPTVSTSTHNHAQNQSSTAHPPAAAAAAAADLPDVHTCRGAAKLPRSARVLNTGGVLQVGGLANPTAAHIPLAASSSSPAPHLRGCVRNLRVNGQLVDLGEGVLSEASTPGCPAADCLSSGLHCGLHARCKGSPGELSCECDPGWTGQDCHSPTTPTTFLPNSYIKLALSFTPLAYTTSISFRFRTWRRRGELVVLSSQHGRDRWSVQLMGGRLCAVLHLHPQPRTSLCLARPTLTDGRWHHLQATRYGSAMVLEVDDGDGDLYNATVGSEGSRLLQVDKQEGVHIAGSPEYVDISIFKIQGDYFDGCMDDLRISGHSVPLPPVMNSTAWGQASMYKGVEAGCNAPSACTNVSCEPPFSCVDTWRSYHCGCGEGGVLSSSRTACEDQDECAWQPCLSGGSCFNTQPGYVCSCPAGFSGQHCHLPDVGPTSLKLPLGVLVTIVVWCIFFVLLLCAFLLHQHHRRSSIRKTMADVKGSTVDCKGQGSPPCTHTPNLLELQIQKPPKANGQPAWAKNVNIADVDVLQVDGSSLPCSLEGRGDGCVVVTTSPARRKRNGQSMNGKKRRSSVVSQDDLRNYRYEGEGSSPGSLSSCLESCSGSGKFLGGFREVAHMVES